MLIQSSFPAVQRVVILGATGSIGVSTLDVLALHPDRFEVLALTAATRVDALWAQCVRWRPRFAVMTDNAAAAELRRRCQVHGLRTAVLAGPQGLVEVAAHPDADQVMAAIVGAAGLAPCLAAAAAGKRLLLANKEALVVGADYFMQTVRRGGSRLLPIDSEHSAIFQSLPDDPGTWSAQVDRLILTASGGPFRQRAPATFASITPDQACAHPNWVMGRKISVDSATMMNKALEVIEAHYLFGLPPERITVVIHPQSVVHSMVQYRDHAVVAQLGTPDMKGPIAYGLAWPHRMAAGAAALDFSSLTALTFEPADTPDHQARFPGLALAWAALAGAPGATAVLNAANEVAVARFLAGRLRFDQIADLNQRTLDAWTPQGAPTSLDDLLMLDAQARALADDLADRLS